MQIMQTRSAALAPTATPLNPDGCQWKKPLFQKRNKGFFNVLNGGAKEARTPDLLNAIQTLYQLSYDPIHKTER